MKIVELREYQIKPGKTDQWLNWMRDELLPYQRSKGMRILNTSHYQDDNGVDFFVWMREFDSEEDRQAVYKETYNDWWTNDVRPKVFELIEESAISVKLMKPLSF